MKQGMDRMNFFNSKNRLSGNCLVAVIVFFGTLASSVLADDTVSLNVSLTSWRGIGDTEAGHSLTISNGDTEVVSLESFGNYGTPVNKSCSLAKGASYGLVISKHGNYSSETDPGAATKPTSPPWMGLLW